MFHSGALMTLKVIFSVTVIVEELEIKTIAYSFLTCWHN